MSDSVRTEVTDTAILCVKRPNFIKRVGRTIGKFIGEFNAYDTAYIEPQHYKFQAMGQMTTRFESYTLTMSDGQEVRLHPEVSTTFGPYAGYSLIFLGYTLQLNNLYLSKGKKIANLSLYTSLVGADFYYRDTHDFNIKHLSIDDPNTSKAIDLADDHDIEFNGFHAKYWGVNAYYIFNHHKHSYPAAYNQSTCQKHSSGSPLAGFGYGHYEMTMDWSSLDDLVREQVPDFQNSFSEDNLYGNVRYTSYSLYGGYSYNWVFARNWLLGASGSVSLNYNRTRGVNDTHLLDFHISDFTVDGLGRLGLVWNNTRYFAGFSMQVHTYTYARNEFTMSNILGNVNLYFGLNFGKKKAYRKPGKFFEF